MNDFNLLQNQLIFIVIIIFLHVVPKCYIYIILHGIRYMLSV